ncbi:MAG: GtrA family protein [Gammaproteobacteria bacterium]|nr:GtrA family protein [Gammaproteobacteria bacterium]MDD9894632.1 GtrA family protein [Gammaproteobacteria bacterium]MDD9959968.1 GtrA family protein [Gammaproteobacteria bacterium]
MTKTKIILYYSVFAFIATLANLLAQELTVRTYAGSSNIYIGILAGTLVGLLSKYYLDKRYIFSFQPRTPAEDAQTFVAYSLTGVGTTFLFWVTEIGFDLYFGSKTARYMGAIIGLTIGYVVKYQLDKCYVFSTQDQD